jgi:phosphatidylglycerophosphate synthase
MRAMVFIVLGAALLIVSTFTKDPSTEKWSSFAFGASFPMFIGGLISIIQYFRQSKQELKATKR